MYMYIVKILKVQEVGRRGRELGKRSLSVNYLSLYIVIIPITTLGDRYRPVGWSLSGGVLFMARWTSYNS